MLLIPTRIVEPGAVVSGVSGNPRTYRAVFDADSGITYVERGPDLISVLTGFGVHVSIAEPLDDWCNKLVEAAARADGIETEEPET